MIRAFAESALSPGQWRASANFPLAARPARLTKLPYLASLVFDFRTDCCRPSTILDTSTTTMMPKCTFTLSTDGKAHQGSSPFIHLHTIDVTSPEGCNKHAAW